MIKRDPENLKIEKVTFNDVTSAVWNRENVQIVFLCPGHLFIKQTPVENTIRRSVGAGYRYETALSERMTVANLVHRLQREVGDVPFLIVLPDGGVYDPRLAHHAIVPMGTVRDYYRRTPDYHKPYR
jgi:hypothetical protein